MSNQPDVKANQLKKMEPVRKMTGGQFIAKTLHGYGVTHVFFVESIIRHSLVEMEALGIKRISAHAEKAAVYMADGYARVSRRPGICMCQAVGGANLAAGLKDPYLGCSPIIALTGRKQALHRHRNAYQEIIQLPMFEPVTKFNASVDSPEQLPHLLRQAFREATTQTPQPVHLDLDGVQGEVTDTVEIDCAAVCEEDFIQHPAFRPLAETEHIQAAARILREAKCPVIVAGGGVVASSAGPAVLELAERLGIPVATSLNGKSAIPGNHPLSLGVVGSYSPWCANRVVSEADLVFFIGSHTGDQVTLDWRIPKPSVTTIQLDINPSELGKNYVNAVNLLGDARVTLERMLGYVPKNAGQNRAWTMHAQEIVGQWNAEIEPLCSSDAKPIRVERLCRELTNSLPPDAVLAVDTGWSGVWTGAMVYLNHPGQTYIRAAGSLGWSYPASLGAKCGAPDRPVFCFTGDGAFYYHLGEMETAVRCGINTVTVINNNSRFGQCTAGVNKAYGDRPGNREEIFCFGDINFARIAQEMGCLGIRVEEPAEIGGAIKQACEAQRPVVIDVVTDPACKAPAPWLPDVQ